MVVGIPQVTKTETQKFANEWLYNGLAVTLDDTAIQFATDWVNILFRQFVQVLAQAQMAQQAAAAPAPKIEEKKPEGIIIEG